MRGSAGDQGTCFGRDKNQKKMSDTQILEPAAMRMKMDPSNCHIMRRPGIGLSEAAGSMQCLAEMVEALQTNGLQADAIIAFLGDPSVQEALSALNFNLEDAERAPLRTYTKLWELFEAIKTPEGEAAVAAARTVAAVGSRLYVCGLQLVQVHAVAKKPGEWADKVPRTVSEDKKVHAWFEDPRNKETMMTALAALMHEAREKLDNYAAGQRNSASDVVRPGGSARRPGADDDEESDDRGKGGSKGKPKKDGDDDSSDSSDRKKRKKRKAKKDKKRKKTSSSASASPSPEKKKQKKQKKDPSVERKDDEPSPKEKAFTQWSLSAAQEVAAKAETFVNDNYTLEELKSLLDSVPEPVRDLAGVGAFHLQLGGMKTAPPIAMAREPLTALKTVGIQCEKWFGSQQVGGGSSGGAGGGAHAAPGSAAAVAPAAKAGAKK